MFYSHEILTSRKYGVATVWLVATLGSKSNLKKVNRKAITEVNVPKACDTILDPDTPLALRLQSNLLYGVTRVYSQQCGYVLADAQATQNNIKTLLKVVRGSFLDTEAGRARPDTLLLQDDPGFLPEFPDLDFDLTQLDLSPVASRPGSSLLSPSGHTSDTSRNRGNRNSLPRLHITTSDIGVFDIGSAGFTVASSRQSLQANAFDFGPLQREAEEEGFLPDVDFEFDSDGNVRDLVPRGSTSALNPNLPILNSDSVLGERNGRDDENVRWLGEDLGFDDGLPRLDDFNLPDAEPFLERDEQQTMSRLPRSSSSARPAEESSTESAEAPVRQRRPQSVQTLPVDLIMELRNSELAEWNSGYITNMDKVAKHRQAAKAAVQAKKNAQHWVLNSGIAGVGQGLGGSKLVSPLDMFTGDTLMRALAIYPDQIAGTRRSFDFEKVERESESQERRKLRRVDDENLRDQGQAMNIADEDIGPIFDDNEIEIGRAAMPELEDRSSTMPWNASASVRRSRPGSSARKLRHFHETSMGGFATSGGASAIGLELGVPGSASRRVSRLTSASPLEGRERGGVIERLSSLEVADEDNTAAIQQSDHLNLDAQDQFEIFGPAATVDTQTAVQTQWMNQAFERESFNFLDYVHHSAAQRNQTSAQDGSDQTDPQVLSEVAFGGLLRPESNTKIVASQAFLHVLSLATKGLLTARQERNDGEIYICPIIST